MPAAPDPNATVAAKKGKGKRPAVRERSAGVLVFRHLPRREREFLLLDYGKHWDYPKGHLEAGEDDETAARRELREETGIADVDLVPDFTHEIHYHFHSSRKGLVKKTVVFFCGTLSAGRPAEEEVSLSEEHVGHAWLAYDEAMARLTFDNAKQVLRAAQAHLDGADARTLS